MTDTADKVVQRLAIRRWETELRAGVPHYRPGQHIAEKALATEDPSEEIYLLAYAAADGHGIVMLLCKLEGFGWSTERVGVRSDGSGINLIDLGENFVLSLRMIAALDRAAGR